MFINFCIEKLFFKKRYLLYNLRKPQTHTISDRYYLQIINDLAAIDQFEVFQSNTVIKTRLQKNNWVLFLMIDRNSNEVIAYYWAVIGNGEYYWHDNFLVYPDTALLCNAYVYSKYRKQGLYKYLIYIAHAYLSEQNNNKVFTIVEKSNTYSLKANKSAGLSIYCKNYLIKFFSFNLLSLFVASSKIKMVLFGSRLFKITLYKEANF